jgi:hypothetical protein
MQSTFRYIEQGTKMGEDSHHRFMLAEQLHLIDEPDKAIRRVGQQIEPRMSTPEALVAVGHTILVIIYLPPDQDFSEEYHLRRSKSGILICESSSTGSLTVMRCVW